MKWEEVTCDHYEGEVEGSSTSSKCPRQMVDRGYESLTASGVALAGTFFASAQNGANSESLSDAYMGEFAVWRRAKNENRIRVCLRSLCSHRQVMRHG